MAQQETMTLKMFQEKFDSEQACREHLFQIRWPNGFRCPISQNETFYFLKSRKKYIEPGATISSDAYRSYNALARDGFDHQPIKFNVKDNPDHLKWLHTMPLLAARFTVWMPNIFKLT